MVSRVVATDPASETLPKLLVVAQLPPPVHGAAVVNEQVVKSVILSKHFRLTVVRIDATTDLKEIRKFSLMKVARSARMFGRVVHNLLLNRPQLAYLPMAPKGFAFYRDAALVALFRSAKIPHVLHFHGRGMRDAHLGKWSEGLARLVLKQAVIVHLSSQLKHDIAPFVSVERIRFVPNGVPDLYSQGITKMQRNTGDYPVIVFLGNMLESKGPLTLLMALAQLKIRQRVFRAFFAGPWRGNLTPEAFQHQIEHLGLVDHVQHLGAVYGDEKVKLLRSADILAFPTDYENEAFPLVVLEGMAAGLVPVTSNIAALPEIVGDVGICVPPNDPIALADALQSLIDDSARLIELQNASRARYVANFTLEHFEQQLTEVLVAAADVERAQASDTTVEMRT